MRRESDPDAHWVADLGGVGEALSRAAIAEADAETSLLRHLAREHDREGRDSCFEIAAPLELHALVRLLRPGHVVEVGVSSGVSSAYLLRALERNGRGTLHSVDLPSRPRPRRAGAPGPRNSWSLPPGRTSGWAVPMSLRTRWDLRLGDKAAVLPLLAEELPAIDMVVYDVPHDERTTWSEFARLDPVLTPGAPVIADHGPGGGLCPSLSRWARRRGTRPVRRTGLGLYGFRAPVGGDRPS